MRAGHCGFTAAATNGPRWESSLTPQQIVCLTAVPTVVTYACGEHVGGLCTTGVDSGVGDSDEPSPTPSPTSPPTKWEPPVGTGGPDDDQVGTEIYRVLGGNTDSSGMYTTPQTSPSQFKLDATGVSFFELDSVPGNGPYLFPLSITLTSPRVPGATAVVNEEPTCMATYTPEEAIGAPGPTHWSVACQPWDETKQTLSILAKAKKIADQLIINPRFTDAPVRL